MSKFSLTPLPPLDSPGGVSALGLADMLGLGMSNLMRTITVGGGRTPIFAAVLIGMVSVVAVSGSGIRDFGMAKAQLYYQEDSNAPKPADTAGFLFAASFEVDDLDRTASGSVTLPNGETHNFVQMPGSTNLFHTKVFDTEEQLHAAYPFGVYTFSMTVDGVVHSATIHLEETPFPSGPHIANFDELQGVDPASPFTVEWAAIPEGTAQDLIFVEIGDHESPKIWEPDYLIGTDTSYTVEAGTLGANRAFESTVSFAGIVDMNTTDVPGAMGSGVVGAWTRFEITTAGEPTGFMIITTTLPDAAMDEPYSTLLQTSEPVGMWIVDSSSSLPPGLTLDPLTGEISGTPSEAGSFDLSVTAYSASYTEQDSQELELTVTNGGELPSIPPITDMSIEDGTFSMVVESPAGDSVRIEKSSDLQTWTVLEVLPAVDGVVEFRDPEADDEDTGFYRVSWE